MSRLVAFGCSHTRGQGLSDVPDPKFVGPDFDPTVKSDFAWPQLLSNKLNIECINCGVSGASNKLITALVSDFNFKIDDICVILWSYNPRWTLFFNESTNISIIPGKDKPLTKSYYKHLYNEYDHKVMNTMMFRYINLHLEKLGIKTYNFSVDYEQCPDEIKEFVLETPSIRKDLVPLYTSFNGTHLNEEGQQVLTNYMLEYIEEYNE